jgi:hypothetical protein
MKHETESPFFTGSYQRESRAEVRRERGYSSLLAVYEVGDMSGV